MTTKDTRTTNEKALGCLALLIAIPLTTWIGAHTVHLTWHGILRAYVPTLPTLTLWDAFAIGVAVSVFTASSGRLYEFKQDDRPTKKWAGVGITSAYAFRYAYVWIVVRYVVGAS